MSVEATSKTMRSYLDVLLARGDLADHFSDEVTWTTIGTPQTMQGRHMTSLFNAITITISNDLGGSLWARRAWWTTM